MDEKTHIFGKGSNLPENAIFRFVATTLEISDIRITFKNFKDGAKRLASVENAMIGLAQEIGITVQQWKDAQAKVLDAKALMAKTKNKGKLKVAKDETPGQDTSETPSN